jgi:hypothetical protein
MFLRKQLTSYTNIKGYIYNSRILMKQFHNIPYHREIKLINKEKKNTFTENIQQFIQQKLDNLTVSKFLLDAYNIYKIVE